MHNKLVERVLAAYSLTPQKIHPASSGYRNYVYPVVLTNAKTINVILYKNEPGMLTRIKNANAVGEHAAMHSLPTRIAISTRIVQIKSRKTTSYAAIYNRLPGSTIPWEAYTMTHLKNLGKTMGDLHYGLRACIHNALPNVANEQLHQYSRMCRYFTQAGVNKALASKINVQLAPHNFKPLLQLCGKLPNQQALHMDFVRGNILFNNNIVTGIIDFEKTAFGHPIFDIARTLAFLLVDCKYKPEEKVRKYFLHSGYNKYSKSQFKLMLIGQQNLLEELLNFFLLHDFYKFLVHNPYEHLYLNEHFTRTKSMLLKRGILIPIMI